MYTLTGSSLESSAWLQIQSPSQKETVSPQIKESKSTYQSSQNEPIPPINSGRVVDSSVESLLKEQIFLMKFILLFLGFMLLSNILAKKN